MIQNAKDMPMGTAAAGLPDVSASVLSFLQPVIIACVQTQMIDGYAQDIKRKIQTMASVQPMDEKMVIRKDGERSWKWSVIHMTPDPGLFTDDVIELLGVTYRVMQKQDWKQHGYVELHVIEDYKAL